MRLVFLIARGIQNLHGSTGDEEPLVDGTVNRGRGQVLALGNGGNLAGIGRGDRGLSLGSSEGNVTSGGLAGDELLPSISTLVDDIGGVLLVLALAGESELVLGLAVGDLVDAEPLVGGAQKAGQVALNVLNVVELSGKRVVDVDDNDLPIGLLLIDQGHDTQNLNLLNLTGVTDQLTNLANIERVVVTLGLGLGVDRVGVLPGLYIADKTVRGCGLDDAFFSFFFFSFLFPSWVRLTRGKAP